MAIKTLNELLIAQGTWPTASSGELHRVLTKGVREYAPEAPLQNAAFKEWMARLYEAAGGDFDAECPPLDCEVDCPCPPCPDPDCEVDCPCPPCPDPDCEVDCPCPPCPDPDCEVDCPCPPCPDLDCQVDCPCPPCPDCPEGGPATSDGNLVIVADSLFCFSFETASAASPPTPLLPYNPTTSTIPGWLAQNYGWNTRLMARPGAYLLDPQGGNRIVRGMEYMLGNSNMTDAIIIWLGTNDVLFAADEIVSESPPGTVVAREYPNIEAKLTQALDAIESDPLAVQDQCPIFVCPPLPLDTATLTAWGRDVHHQEGIRKAVEDAAAASAKTLVQYRDDFPTIVDATHRPDGIHLNAVGALLIADWIQDTLLSGEVPSIDPPIPQTP